MFSHFTGSTPLVVMKKITRKRLKIKKMFVTSSMASRKRKFYLTICALSKFITTNIRFEENNGHEGVPEILVFRPRESDESTQ